MRIIATGVTVAVSLVVMCCAAMAGEDGKSLPNLVGTWTGVSKSFFTNGARQATRELKITEQDGPYFRGIWSWKNIDKGEALGEVGGKRVTEANEPVVGVIGFDGKTIHVAEKDDWGRLYIRLKDPNTIQLIYAEVGPAAKVTRCELKRKQ